MKKVINRDFLDISEWIGSIPKIFDSEGSIVYQARNTLKRISHGNTDFVVKRYAVPIFINRLAYTFFRKSKAQRAYENAARLTDYGIKTPCPVAYMELKRCGLLHRSYFVSLADDSPYMMRQYVDFVNSGEEIIKQFARFTKLIHDNNILHLDYSPGNILFSVDGDGKASFSIIDLNRMRFDVPLTREERLRNFRRLTRSDEVLKIMINEYASLCGWDKREAFEEAAGYSRGFWEKTDRKIALKKKLKKTK